MNDNNKNYFNLLSAALVGGIAGALVVYFSDEARRKQLMNKVRNVFEQSEEKGLEVKENIDKSFKNGRKVLAKKIHQVENKIAQK